MKVDNEGGACSALHVSPTVAAKPRVECEDVGSVMDSTEAGVMPGARGPVGMVDARETNNIAAGKLEH